MADLTGLINGFEITRQILFYVMFGLVLFGGKEIVNKIKRTLYKRKAINVELIGPDRKSSIIVCKKKDDGYYEVDNMPFFINPLKSIKRGGVDVFTHVLGNSFSHDFINNPKEVLKKIIIDCKAEKKIKEKDGKESNVKDLTEEFHNIFDEPYRVDARMLQEVLINAQLSSKTLWDELIKVFKNKNLITIAIIAIIGIGIILLLSWQIYDAIVHLEICKMAATVSV